MRVPNVVIIMSDQQRADFMRGEGYPLDTMPFVDSLARGGMRFRNAYTPMPVCAPARCCMFTGRFAKATRVRQNRGTLQDPFRPVPDLVDILRSKGYSIHLVGKNHSYLTRDSFDTCVNYGHLKGGDEATKTDAERVNDEWVGSQHFALSLEPNPNPLTAQLPTRLVRDAIRCVDELSGGPFFMWLSFPEPHNPYQCPEPYFSMFDPGDIPDRFAGPEEAVRRGGKWKWMWQVQEKKWPGYDEHWRKIRAVYLGMLRQIDDQCRRFVEHLDSKKLLGETILVFTSDHGCYVCEYGLQRKGVGLVESLVRIPLIVAGPGVSPCERPRDEFVSLVDLMPTFCEAVGEEIPYGVQGRSLWPVLTGDKFPAEEFRSIYAEAGYGGLHYTGEEPDPPVHFRMEGRGYDELNSVTQSGNAKMVRKDKWKLVFDMMGAGELYDLQADPGELTNLYDRPEMSGVRAEMLAELLRWTIRTEDDLPGGAYVPKRAERNWYAPHAAETRPGAR